MSRGENFLFIGAGAGALVGGVGGYFMGDLMTDASPVETTRMTTQLTEAQKLYMGFVDRASLCAGGVLKGVMEGTVTLDQGPGENTESALNEVLARCPETSGDNEKAVLAYGASIALDQYRGAQFTIANKNNNYPIDARIAFVFGGICAGGLVGMLAGAMCGIETSYVSTPQQKRKTEPVPRQKPQEREEPKEAGLRLLHRQEKDD